MLRQLLECAGAPALSLGTSSVENQWSIIEPACLPSESGAAAPQSKTLREFPCSSHA